jgi:hypothetical protein
VFVLQENSRFHGFAGLCCRLSPMKETDPSTRLITVANNRQFAENCFSFYILEVRNSYRSLYICSFRHALKTWIGTSLDELIVSPLPNFTTSSGVLRVFEHLTRFSADAKLTLYVQLLARQVIPKMPFKVHIFETKSHIFQTIFYFF